MLGALSYQHKRYEMNYFLAIAAMLGVFFFGIFHLVIIKFQRYKVISS